MFNSTSKGLRPKLTPASSGIDPFTPPAQCLNIYIYIYELNITKRDTCIIFFTRSLPSKTFDSYYKTTFGILYTEAYKNVYLKNKISVKILSSKQL